MEKKKKKAIQINDTNYNSIASIYDEKFYITDRITKNYYLTDHPLNYQYFYVTICKNGGLIAMCKFPDYMEIGSKNLIMRNIIVMHQDGVKKYCIKYSDICNKHRKIVGLEFNHKEQLYAFCDNGEIFKIDILKESAKQLEFTSDKLKYEKILKVKAFEKGFVILTKAGTIFYLRDLKGNTHNPLEFIVSLRDNLKIKNYEDCDFLVIPSSESEKNSEEELLICKPNKEGVFLIKKNISIGGEFTFETKFQNYSDRKINAFYINSSTVNEIDFKKNEIGDEDLENKYDDNRSFGPVSAIAISNSNKKIALYVAKKKAVYIFSSNIPSKGRLNYKKLEFKIENEEDEDKNEANEKNSILNFLNKQLLFVSDDCVAIVGGRWVVMVNDKGKTFVEDLNIDKSSTDTKLTNPYIYCKGTTEVDGLRILTTNEIYLIRRMPDDLKPVYDTFEDNQIKQLISSYEKYVAKDPISNEDLREMKENLSDAIFTLMKAAGYLYWIENDKEPEIKELQSFFLKAANYGKSIFGKGEFYFDKFNNLCMDLRIINALRNFKEKPRFITLEEYNNINLDMNDNILQRTMRQLNFKLAFEIAKFLGLPEKDVYLKYAFKTIKKIDVEDNESVNEVYNKLMPMLKKLENISYIDIAKKCFKYNKNQLGEKFLDNEKSSFVKIPQYLELKNWKKAIELAIQSNDINTIMIVLDNIYKVESKQADKGQKINKVFIKTLIDFPSIKIPVINYLKKKNKMEDLLDYLEKQKDNEELFYLFLEQFFNCQNKSQREELLKKMKDCKPEKFDKKFYENYISDLESSLKFKKECIDKGIFGKNDTTNFDNSIYDCFEKAISKEFDWIKKENNNNFKLSTRKITILRIKELLKKGKIEEIDKLVEEGIKKLEISYIKIAMMFLEDGNKEKALEYAQKENNENLYEDKADLLIKLENYEDAAETALKIKDQEKFEELFNIIATKVGGDHIRIEKIQKIYDRRK